MMSWFRLLKLCGSIFLFFVAPACADRVVYTAPPSDFTPKATVSCCLCTRGEKILLLLANKEKGGGNPRSLPGGAVALSESPIGAALRHLKELTGIELPKEDCSVLRKFYIRLPDQDLELYLFKADVGPHGTVILNPEKSSGFEWVTPEGALELPLIPGTEVYVQRLLDQKK